MLILMPQEPMHLAVADPGELDAGDHKPWWRHACLLYRRQFGVWFGSMES